MNRLWSPRGATLLVLLLLAARAAAGGPKPAAACDGAKLPGLWTSPDYSMRIAADLSYEAAGAPNVMTIDVHGTLAVKGCRLRLTDTGGSFACPSSQVGIYTFRVSAEALTLTLVEDACEGRRQAVNGVRLTRSKS